jgi:HlyD family secretion protein
MSAAKSAFGRRTALLWGGALLFVVAIGGAFTWKQTSSSPAGITAAAAVPAQKKATGIACIGWVEPESGLVIVSAAPMGAAPLVSRLLVREGDDIRKGQLLAELSTLSDLEAAVRQAEARVELATKRISQVKAGARPSDAKVIQAQIDRLQADLSAARADLTRKEALLAKDYIPLVQVEAVRLHMDQLRRSIEEASIRLNSLSETRSADVDVAEAELRMARADLDAARVRLATAMVKAPQDGRVLKVFARAGESIGPAGLLELAPAGRMAVIAEIYETDAARVRVGQNAKITAETLSSPATGKVAWISPQIEQRQSPSLDPAMFSEARVFKARVIVDQDQLFRDRIHAKVDVVIEP